MSEEIPEGKYQAKPTVCGLIKTGGGHLQFAIECAVEVPVEGGEPRTVVLTKFQNLAEQGLEYAETDAKNCGCDVTQEMQNWMVDTTKTVTVIVEHSEYQGKKQVRLKSIFSNDREGGFLIKKMAINPAEDASEVIGINERMAALRALRAQNSAQSMSAGGGVASGSGSNGSSNGAKPAAKPPAVATAPKSKVPF